MKIKTDPSLKNSIVNRKKPLTKTTAKKENRPAVKLEDWLELIQAACATSNATDVRKLIDKATAWKLLPIDCMNEAQLDDEQIEKLIEKISQQFNDCLPRLDDDSALAQELCCLRDIVFSTYSVFQLHRQEG